LSSKEYINQEPRAKAAHPYETIVPEGKYEVAFIRCEEGTAYREKRWFGHFEIVDLGNQHHGKPVLRFWNIPKGRVARTSNLFRDYVAVTNRRPPMQGIKPDKFLKGCIVEVEVVTVEHRNEGRQRIKFPESCHYSKINRILRRTAGTPPCL
jgi:hypothetical protein